ncbi:alpha/beta hydrolase [Actinoallomurus acaciae]|uniref:Lipase n=1 Tax=Actinoallomurus acaciae TaxID=502577 RepID=A0ABV5YL85_9ACTN
MGAGVGYAAADGVALVPGVGGTGHTRRVHDPGRSRSALPLKGAGITTVPPDTLSRIRTGAYAGAAPAHGWHPLVVLSPGFSLPRSSLTSLGEDLASQGYVVAGIDHTYENFGETFPDGHTTTCVACEFDPLLLMSTAAMHTPSSRDTTWSDAWQHLTGWKPWITVTGTERSSFTDRHPLADELGRTFGADISGARAVQITRAYGAFFDRSLRHRPEPPLDGPSSIDPKVTFWN